MKSASVAVLLLAASPGSPAAPRAVAPFGQARAASMHLEPRAALERDASRGQAGAGSRLLAEMDRAPRSVDDSTKVRGQAGAGSHLVEMDRAPSSLADSKGVRGQADTGSWQLVEMDRAPSSLADSTGTRAGSRHPVVMDRGDSMGALALDASRGRVRAAQMAVDRAPNSTLGGSTDARTLERDASSGRDVAQPGDSSRAGHPDAGSLPTLDDGPDGPAEPLDPDPTEGALDPSAPDDGPGEPYADSETPDAPPDDPVAPASDASAHDGPEPVEAASEPRRPPRPPPDSGVIGGYRDFGELRGRGEPKDGGTEITTGAILLPLGLVRTGGGVVQIYLAETTRCMQLYSGISAESCQGLMIYGAIGTAFGGLMAISGAALLGIGYGRRARHRAWQREHGLALAPMTARGGGGLVINLRF